jgi:hypothetical protein
MIPNLISNAGDFTLQEKGKEIKAVNLKGVAFNEWYGYQPQDFGYKYLTLVRYKNVQVPYFSLSWEFDHSKDDGDGIAMVSLCLTAFSTALNPYVYSGTKCTPEKAFKLKDAGETKISTKYD